MNYIRDFVRNTPFACLDVRKCMGSSALGAIIQGVSSITAAGLSSGLSAGSTANANKRGVYLTREMWDKQVAEAQRNREWNAEQAALARDYYSESSVAQRMEDAGLNTALVAGNSATSGASASSSPASLGSPSPQQAADFGSLSQLGDVGLKILQGQKLSEETKSVAQQRYIDGEMASITLSEHIANMRKLTADTKLTSANTSRAEFDTTIAKSFAMQTQRAQLQQIHLFSFLKFQEQRLASNKAKFDANLAMANWETNRSQINLMARRYRDDFVLNLERLRFDSGSRRISSRSGSRSVNLSDSQNSSRTNNFDVQVGLAVSAGVNASANAATSVGVPLVASESLGVGVGADARFGVDGSLSSGVSETSSISESFSDSRGMSQTDQFEERFVNTTIGKMISRCEAMIMIVEDPKSSREQVMKALNEMVSIDTDFEAYLLFLRQFNSEAARSLMEGFDQDGFYR